MLRTSLLEQFLPPEDLDVLARVVQSTRRLDDPPLDLECRAATLVQLFQSGFRDEATFAPRCDVPGTGWRPEAKILSANP